MDPVILNWLKDVGIATVTLLVLGKIMAELLHSTIEFYRGVREDNQARNEQFETLLSINQAIAGQMELTRQAIDHSTRRSEQHDRTIRSSVEVMTAMRADLTSGLVALGQQITGARQDILDSLEQMRSAEALPEPQSKPGATVQE
jgi:hypothetical protein